MDNLTHSLAGWALGQAGLKTQTRKGLAALILGANMPDIDVFFGGFPWEPLAMHRGFTHSLVGGVVVMPPILFGLLWLLDRFEQSFDRGFKGGLPMRPGWLLALCYVGAASHPLLDLLTTYSVQLLSPFSGAWFHSDGLFIIDLWLWLLLGGAVFTSTWREKRGLEWRRPVQAILGIALAYIAINLVISERAYAAVREWAGERPATAIFASPPPVASWRRGLAWREDRCYRFSRYDPLGGGIGPVSDCSPTNLDDAVVRQAITMDPALQRFLRWSVMPFAEVERDKCEIRIALGDARYGDSPGRSRLMRRSAIPTGAPGCQGAAASQ